MPEMLVASFTGLLLVALAAVILSSVLFRNAPPLKRSAATAVGAWVVCSAGASFLPRAPDTSLWGAPLYFLPFAVIVWLLMWRSFSLYWEPDRARPVLVAAPANWPTFQSEATDWPAEPMPERHRNYLLRHWRGECSLPVAYWLNGGIIAGAAVFGVAFALGALEDSGASLRTVAIAALLFLAMTIVVWAWSAVGIWRSAQLHEDRGGSGGWAITAQVMVVLGALGMFMQLKTYILQTHEYGVIALGGDPLGEPGTVVLSGDGTEIRIEGLLTSGVSGRFRTIASGAPRLREVIVTSPGGRQLEALHIAETIAQRRLDTRAERQCMSACTFILLAGRERTAAEGTAIGFHQPAFPGWSAADVRAATAEMEADYLRAGVGRDFLRRALATPSYGMWIPRHEELIAANVLTSSEMVVRARGKDAKETLD